MMRITTQMLNESMRKAGIPLNRSSLLDYVNNGGGSGSNSLLNELSAKNKQTVNNAYKKNYEKQEKAADALGNCIGKFTDTGSGSMFEKAKASGDTSEIRKEVENLVSKYNNLNSAMKESSGTMDEFYKKRIKELLNGNKDALSAIGISIEGDGSMKLNQDTLKNASVETLEKTLGKDSSFCSDLSFLASAVENNADANLESVTSSYLPNGSTSNSYFNKYDFWG